MKYLYAILASLFLAIIIVNINNSYLAPAKLNALVATNNQAKADALHWSIVRALMNEPETDYSYQASKCTAPISSPDDFDHIVAEGTYTCPITAASGTKYTAEIDLIIVNQNIIAPTAYLTPQ